MTNTPQPARPFKLKHLLAGSIALFAILAGMGIPLAYGLRKLGLTHFGGIVESVSFDREGFDPANPLTVRVAVEPSRGLERYGQVEIRARAFVESNGQRQALAEFREIPVGRKFSNKVRAHPGAVVALEADKLDATDVAVMRKAGAIVVVVDEYENGKVVQDAVAELRVPVKFTLLDAVGHVFSSTPTESR